MSDTQWIDRWRGCLVGLALGDALGTTLEFRPPGSFAPLTDLVGGGHFCLRKGYWTDDTSMALCLGHSLVACHGFDATDQMRRYCAWLDEGYLSSLGTCFDVGNTVRTALRRFQRTGEPYAGSQARWSAGNGSIMRLAPIPMAYALLPDQAVARAMDSSRTTHAATLCLEGCAWLTEILVHLLHGADKAAALGDHRPATSPEIRALQQGTWREKPRSALRGSGYVVASLEAALWCFWHTDNYAACVLAAANLGDDADTTAAVAGQLAGACYGYQAIREDWRAALYQGEAIRQLADDLWRLAQQLAAEAR